MTNNATTIAMMAFGENGKAVTFADDDEAPLVVRVVARVVVREPRDVRWTEDRDVRSLEERDARRVLVERFTGRAVRFSLSYAARRSRLAWRDWSRLLWRERLAPSYESDL